MKEYWKVDTAKTFKGVCDSNNRRDALLINCSPEAAAASYQAHDLYFDAIIYMIKVSTLLLSHGFDRITAF